MGRPATVGNRVFASGGSTAFAGFECLPQGANAGSAATPQLICYGEFGSLTASIHGTRRAEPRVCTVAVRALLAKFLKALRRAFLIKSSSFIPSTSVRRRSVSTVGVLSSISIKLNVCRDNPARAVVRLSESFWRNRSCLSNRAISEQMSSRNVSLPTPNNYKNRPLTNDATKVAC